MRQPMQAVIIVPGQDEWFWSLVPYQKDGSPNTKNSLVLLKHMQQSISHLDFKWRCIPSSKALT